MSDYCSKQFYTDLSMRLSSVLEDVGVTEEIMMTRRGSYLFQETSINMIGKPDERIFYFGSQSEGTTTLGLHSDIDMLRCDLSMHVMRDLAEWRPGMVNLMMLKDQDLPPQQYVLQIVRHDSPQHAQYNYTTSVDALNRKTVRGDGTSVFLSSKMVLEEMKEYCIQLAGSSHSAGPSASWSDEHDVVQAYGVNELMPEVKQWIDRHKCTPGSWPPKHLLEAAQNCSCFLVPAGHPFSDTKYIEWRLSPNLIERMLMFSLNITQLKCYVLLKMIKKSLLHKVVENGISSFHFKTVLFYTMENTSAQLWQEHNLVLTVMLCLHTLRRWLKRGVCPHYIIQGVNLFDGKLTFSQSRILYKSVSSLIKNPPNGLCSIDIDNFGMLMSQSADVRQSKNDRLRNAFHLVIRSRLEFDRLQRLYAEIRHLLIDEHKDFDEFLDYTHTLISDCAVYCVTGDALEQNVSATICAVLSSYHASLRASIFIRNHTPINESVLTLFSHSFVSDSASTQLKLASILICSGYLHSAVAVLYDIERRMNTGEIKPFCACGSIDPHNIVEFLSYADANQPLNESNIACCVRFLRHEAYCVPPALLFEMNRTGINAKYSELMPLKIEWDRDVCVEAVVFVCYLQYLAYGGLGERVKQICSLKALALYIDTAREAVYHLDTALNLLGHCFEMENRMDSAIAMYSNSLKIKPHNNAANWHIKRIQK